MNSDSDADRGPWDFKTARRFLHAFRISSDPHSSTSSSTPNISPFDPTCEIPKSLGDFDRCLTFVGKPINIKPPRVRDIDSSSARSILSTPPSSAPDDIDNGSDGLERSTRGKEVRWKDELGTDLAEIRRRSRIRISFGFHTAEDSGFTSGYETDQKAVDASLPDPFSYSSLSRIDNTRLSKGKAPKNALYSSELLPSTITPAPIRKALIPKGTVQPIYMLSAGEQQTKLLRKLSKKFPESKSDLDLSLSRLHTEHPDGIHVFVDCSNIIIGWYNQLKANRKIHCETRIRSPPISYHSLALVLERGRKVSRRVLVGSYGHSSLQISQPGYIGHAEAYGYEINLLDKVQKIKRRTSPKKKRHGIGSGYATTPGYSSGSETPLSGQAAWQEQAVDEILQLKLCESLLDTKEPTTIVLASGDAAEAEFSGGFFKCVQRALSLGWKVEVVSWKEGLSKEYKSAEFLNKWKDQFMVVELDDFCEEMLASYARVYSHPV